MRQSPELISSGKRCTVSVSFDDKILGGYARQTEAVVIFGNESVIFEKFSPTKIQCMDIKCLQKTWHSFGSNHTIIEQLL